MTAKKANILKQLLHAKKYGYKVYITLELSCVFGYVEKVTEEEVVMAREGEFDYQGTLSVNLIGEVRHFYHEMSLDLLET